MRRFTTKTVSLGKREVRERLYGDLVDVLPSIGRFGLLAGAVPEEEIGCVRRRFFRPTITAFDLDAEHVEAAAACGVAAVRGNLRHSETWQGRKFDFFNLDLCRTLATETDLIEEAARRSLLGLSVFVSYRNDAIENEITICRERANDQETTSEVERANVLESTMSIERATRRETTSYPERANSSETTTDRERLSYEQQLRVRRILDIVRRVRPDAQLRRAYAYRSVRGHKKQNGADMVGCLIVFRKKPIDTLPEYHPSYEDATDERAAILRGQGLSPSRAATLLSRSQKAKRK